MLRVCIVFYGTPWMLRYETHQVCCVVLWDSCVLHRLGLRPRRLRDFSTATGLLYAAFVLRDSCMLRYGTPVCCVTGLLYAAFVLRDSCMLRYGTPVCCVCATDFIKCAALCYGTPACCTGSAYGLAGYGTPVCCVTDIIKCAALRDSPMCCMACGQNVARPRLSQN